MTPPRELNPEQLRHAMRLSLWDVIAYAFMLGLGEAYFLADAVRLRASVLELGLVVSLPLFLGAAGPLLAARLLARASARRPFVVACALGQTTALFALSACAATGVLTPRILIGLAVAYQVCGQAAGTAWSSWYGDLVPATVRGRWFARRNRRAHAATSAGLLSAGLLLQVLEPAGPVLASGLPEPDGRGFAVIYGLAGLARVASTWLLAVSPERRTAGPTSGAHVVRFLATQRGTRAWRLVVLVALMQMTVYVASPYFQPYMLEELRFSYVEFMLASLCVVTLKVVGLPLWGGWIDRWGARPACGLGAVCIALVPLPWLWADGLGWVMFAQGFSGFSWSGFELSNFSLLLETSYKRTRLAVFAAQSVLNGTAQLVGTLTGGLLVTLAATDLRTLFGLSLVGRLAAALALARLLPTPRGLPAVRARDLMLRVVGWRPSGVVHRPIEPASSHPDDRPSEPAESGRPTR